MKSEAEKKLLETEFDCEYTDSPTCPYCGYKQECDLNEFVGNWNDEARWEAFCNNCSKTYFCFTGVQYSFDAFKAPCLNGEPHKIRYSCKIWENKHLFKCIWCDTQDIKELSAQPTDEEKQDFEIN